MLTAEETVSCFNDKMPVWAVLPKNNIKYIILEAFQTTIIELAKHRGYVRIQLQGEEKKSLHVNNIYLNKEQADLVVDEHLKMLKTRGFIK